MIYKILSNGEEINRIVADEAFCKIYCAENGFTYELEQKLQPDTEAPSGLDQLRADIDYLAALAGVEL